MKGRRLLAGLLRGDFVTFFCLCCVCWLVGWHFFFFKCVLFVGGGGFFVFLRDLFILFYFFKFN